MPVTLNDVKKRVNPIGRVNGLVQYLEENSGGGSSTVTAADITDATAVGRSVLKATDAATARTALGAGTPYTLPAATTAANGGVKKAVAQTDSVATDAAGLVTDFNALLAKLRTAGILS